MSEWISVDERTPERNANVLYWHLYRARAAWPDLDGFVAIADEWHDEDHLGYASHWMPLPEPPK